MRRDKNNPKIRHGENEHRRKSFGQGIKAGSFQEFINPKKAQIKDISLSNKGDGFSITASVDKIMQTGGPTVFYVSDGTGTLALKAFEKAGMRAYPNVDVGDTIKVAVTIEEFNGELEGEVKSLHKLTGEEKKSFEKEIAQREIDRAKVTPIAFLVDSQVLEK